MFKILYKLFPLFKKDALDEKSNLNDNIPIPASNVILDTLNTKLKLREASLVKQVDRYLNQLIDDYITRPVPIDDQESIKNQGNLETAKFDILRDSLSKAPYEFLLDDRKRKATDLILFLDYDAGPRPVGTEKSCSKYAGLLVNSLYEPEVINYFITCSKKNLLDIPTFGERIAFNSSSYAYTKTEMVCPSITEIKVDVFALMIKVLSVPLYVQAVLGFKQRIEAERDGELSLLSLIRQLNIDDPLEASLIMRIIYREAFETINDANFIKKPFRDAIENPLTAPLHSALELNIFAILYLTMALGENRVARSGKVFVEQPGILNPFEFLPTDYDVLSSMDAAIGTYGVCQYNRIIGWSNFISTKYRAVEMHEIKGSYFKALGFVELLLEFVNGKDFDKFNDLFIGSLGGSLSEILEGNSVKFQTKIPSSVFLGVEYMGNQPENFNKEWVDRRQKALDTLKKKSDDWTNDFGREVAVELKAICEMKR